MALQVGAHPRATPRAAFLSPSNPKYSITFTIRLTNHPKPTGKSGGRAGQSSRIRVSDGGDSYLDFWKRAVERERTANSAGIGADDDGGGDSAEVLERKSREFQKILEVPSEERDRIQRMQVIDRAAAAIAAARAILKESLPRLDDGSGVSGTEISSAGNEGDIEAQQRGTQDESSIASQSGGVGNGAPGPNFWSWTPPPESDINFDDENNLNLANQTSPYPYQTNPVMEKEQPVDFLSIPLESKLFESNQYPPLPPFQSLMEVEKVEALTSSEEMAHVEEKVDLGILSSANAAEAVRALNKGDVASPQGVNPDGSRWWKETGIEQRPDGVVCRWTLTRGVSADKGLEWEEKYWEAADQFGYKELGSEKSGRDAVGNVWREFWRESMWQDHGLVHLEKTADKWGKNGKGDEWQEKWWEHYDDSGQAEKWAHKWCSIDPSTPLEAGHAHVWHERWGEKYDGKGSSMKYTDKWAERSETDGWTKWGDKWDEHFDSNGHGTKQGETWWKGKYGERWNRTWGEGHDGSGWVHKYGKSSSGEHWDTHVEQDTWYERYPHYGFQHCFDNSVQLREVPKPSEWS